MKHQISKYSHDLWTMTHILHKKSSKEIMSLEMFYGKVAKGLIASARTDIQEQGQTSNPAGRLDQPTDHFVYRIPATQGRVKGKTQRSCRVSAEKSKARQEKPRKIALRRTAENAILDFV
jgi:hypothetical protein